MTYRRCFSDAGLFYVTRDDGKVIAFDDASSAENCLAIASRVDRSLWSERGSQTEYTEVDSWAEAATLLMRKLIDDRD